MGGFTSAVTSSASLRPRASLRPERFDESVKALPPFHLRRGERAVGQGRGAGEPEADELRQRLVGNPHMPLDPLQVTRESGLQAVGAVGRRMRGERRFDDERLRNSRLEECKFLLKCLRLRQPSCHVGRSIRN
jgi:hypothetical protein